MNAIDLIHWTEERKENNDLDAGNLRLEKDVGNCGSEKRLAVPAFLGWKKLLSNQLIYRFIKCLHVSYQIQGFKEKKISPYKMSLWFHFYYVQLRIIHIICQGIFPHKFHTFPVVF